MSDERDYVLGTHDEEVERLGLQHRVWRPRALDAWRRAGFTAGSSILDVGCGPGYASIDLAGIVGKSGRVVAVDRSRRFLDVLERRLRERRLENIETFELDLDRSPLPERTVDGAWARWIFAFVTDPRALLARVAERIRPGGAFVAHEYFDYRTWRLTPRSPELEEFVSEVVESWRETGGEPDVGLALPRWLEENGFEVRELKPIVDVVARSNFVWEWPRAFVGVGLARLAELGRITPQRSRQISEAFSVSESAPGTLMVTPAVLEILAVKR